MIPSPPTDERPYDETDPDRPDPALVVAGLASVRRVCRHLELTSPLYEAAVTEWLEGKA